MSNPKTNPVPVPLHYKPHMISHGFTPCFGGNRYTNKCMYQGAALRITFCSITCPSRGSHGVSITVTTLVTMLKKVIADYEGNYMKHMYRVCGKIPVFITLLWVGQHINQYVSNTQHLHTHSNFMCHNVNAQNASFNSVTLLHSLFLNSETPSGKIFEVTGCVL